ncbi:MAG: hypothetical protein ACOYKE_04105 [Ferruginibacter sp.]
MIKLYLRFLGLCMLMVVGSKAMACPTPGTYTIGPTGTYTTIGAAITDLNSCSITGAFIFEFQSTYNSAVESFPIIMPLIAGASATNTITFRPALGATTLITSAASGTIQMNGARFIYFDGRAGGVGTTKSLTIQNTLVGTAYAVQLINDASNNSFTYCNIRSATNSGASGTIFFSTTNGTTGNDNNTIDRCDIFDATTGTPRNGIYGDGNVASTTLYNSGNIISNNNIYNYYSSTVAFNGIFLNGANTDFTITGNSFYQTVTRTLASTRGLSAVFIFNNGSTGGVFQVTNNFVGGNAAGATGTMTLTGAGAFIPFNFYVGSTTATTVQNNIVQNVNYSTTTAASPTVQRVFGIFAGSVNCTFNTVKNINYSWAGGNLIVSAISAGISTGYVGTVDISDNTISDINVNVTGATSPRFWAIYLIDAPTAFTTNRNTITNISSNANQTFRGIASLSTSVNNTINGNVISNISQTTSGTSAQLSAIFIANNRNFTIQNNIISGITSASTNAGVGTGAAIVGINITNTGISNVIASNKISSVSATSLSVSNISVLGITTSNNSAGGNITGNRIWDFTNTSTGASNMIAGFYPTGGNWTVSNNMISLSNAPNTNAVQCYGMYDGGGSGIRYYLHNTIYIGGTNGGANNSAAFQYNTAAGASAIVKNNIFQSVRSGSSGKYYSIANAGPAVGGLVSNTNILNNINPATLALSVGPLDQTFEQWKTTSSGDANSYTNITVPFVNTAIADLHINTTTLNTTPTVIESKGEVTTVIKDYDDQDRPPLTAINGGATAPDLGADEIDAVPEIFGPQINYVTISTPTCAVDQTVVAQITDNTGMSLTGSLIPRIYYRKNSGSWVSQPGTFISGTTFDATWKFSILAIDLNPLSSGDVVEYYVSAQDLVKPDANVSATPQSGFSATDVLTIVTNPTTPNQYTIDPSSSGIWLGNDNNWTSTTNWCGGVPNSTTNVTIAGNAVNFPVITGTQAVNNITVGTGASFTIDPTAVFSVNGNFNSAGTLTNNGTIQLSSSTVAQSFPGTAGTIAAMKNLTINNTSGLGVTINKGFSITGALNPTAGLIDLNNATITLKSTATSTAMVGAVGNGFTYTGSSKFEVERYFPARRAWRLVTAPLNTTGTIFDHWQAGAPALYTPGEGTFITGPNPTGAAGNGLDWSSNNNYSLKKYVNNNYVDIGNTKVALSGAGSSAANTGYFLFVRGDRNRTPDNTVLGNTNTTTLKSGGKLQTGAQSFSISNVSGTYALIGNPYAASVDFNALTKNNVYPYRYYTFDPNFGQVGAFIVMEDLDMDGVFTPSNLITSTQDNYIQSSQAFFVQPDVNNIASTLVFEENHKSSSDNRSVFRPQTPTPTAGLRMNAYYLNAGNQTTLIDGILAEFNDRFKADVDIQDALKFSNVNENAGFIRNNRLMAVERRPVIQSTDTLFLRFTRTTQRDYRFEFVPTLLQRDNLAAFLEDKFMATQVPLYLNKNSVYDFAINGNAASSAADRFRIVFKPIMNTTSLTALANGNDVLLNWTVPAEYNMDKYIIERSTDSMHFSAIDSVWANSNLGALVQYSYTDGNPVTGYKYYYRVRGVSKHAVEALTKTVSITLMQSTKALYVFPNPVVDQRINIQLNNQLVGNYLLQLIDAQGKILQAKTIAYGGGRQAISLQLTTKFAAGMYQLKCINPNQQLTVLPVWIK